MVSWRPCRTRARTGAAVLLLLPAVLGACELATETVASPTPRVVVHAVLNPDENEQVILLESSLSGRFAVDTMSRFEPLDPIRTGGGEPIENAEVWLFADDDSTGVQASETVVDRGGGVFSRTGRYSVRRWQMAIIPGRTYRLRVRTPDGQVITGETRVPSAQPGWNPGDGRRTQTVPLNRSRDTLQLTWPEVPDARTYAIRVETPNGPWFLFSDSTRFSLSGRLRNFFAEGLPAVWYPGFDQIASVAAVDRNFYDYNRSGNDPFGGTGLISSVQGGLGLFGSTLNLLRRQVQVSEEDRFPLDARWIGEHDVRGPVRYDLWVETNGSPRASVSGRERYGAQSDRFMLGTLEGDRLRLVTLRGTSSTDTAAYFIGQVSGDTITGTYDARFETGGARVLVRQPRRVPVTARPAR